MKGFVYTGRLDEASLRILAHQTFGDALVFHITEALDDYRPGSGLPADLKRQGRLFAESAELRYERVGNTFTCLLLTEREMGFVPPCVLEPVPGAWETAETEQLLMSTSAPHVKPLFTQYPNAAQRVSVSVYCDRGLPRFTRLRSFIP
jgi:hypothetical protein